MLTFYNDARDFNRRDFLRVGGLALGGMTLPQLLAARAAAAGASDFVKDKSVVFLFMHGGPTQTETFDPKMTAPSGIRSVTGERTTTLPGVTFGGTFEKLAALAHRVAVVRSFKTGTANHDIKPIVCDESLDANLGSLYARVVGNNRADNGLPTNMALFPRAVDEAAMPAVTQFGNFLQTGMLGSAYAPFVPGGGGELQQAMKLTFSQDRLDDRRNLLAGLDRIKREADASGLLEGLDKVQQQAFDTIIGGAADAFDLSKEDPKTVERYDTSPLFKPEQISKAWNNHPRYVDNAKSLGKLLLLARRLCEAGCGFITVTTNFVWDMHADQNNATIQEGMQYMGNPFDHAVSAFIEDVHARGLDDKILLVCCGEMGRTPKVNAKGGRDHWGNISPLLLFGGGLKMGQVIGQSTDDAGEPATSPYTNKHLIATIMHTLFDVGRLRLERGIPVELSRLITNNEPIAELH